MQNCRQKEYGNPRFRFAYEMSFVETGQMSAFETGQMTAAEASVLSHQKTSFPSQQQTSNIENWNWGPSKLCMGLYSSFVGVVAPMKPKPLPLEMSGQN